MLIMWNFVILFIASIANVVSLRVESPNLYGGLDVDTFIDVLNYQENDNKKYPSHNQQHSSDSKSFDESENDEDNSIYGSLKSQEIINLIEQASHSKYVDDVVRQKKNRLKHNFNENTSGENLAHDDHLMKQILDDLKAQLRPTRKPRKQMIKKNELINNIVKSVNLRGDELDGASLDGYSKIYIILNPQAVQKSNSKASIADIISKLSSLSSASFPKERAAAKKDQRYKGFAVKEGVFSRRARRDSKEKYDLKDSLEDNYKQKRARNDYGGGRTAIPYIRHRGDIYERDV